VSSDAQLVTLRRHVERLLGVPAASLRPTRGGWSVSVRGIVELTDGRRVFAKLGDVRDTERAIRIEIGVYELLGPRPFLPRLLAADRSVPVLVIEALEHAEWPPPWSRRSLEALQRLHREIESTRAPLELPTVASWVAAAGSWEVVAADPEPLLRSGAVPEGWLRTNLSTLVSVAAGAPTDGESLQHGDLRSDNLAILGDRALPVDWNAAMRGDPRWDRLCILHTLQMEGVGPVDELAPDANPAIIAWNAGFFAARVGLPPPEGAPEVRTFQRDQLAIVLPWACRRLALTPPEG
jgi:hypothetical protein